MSECPQMNPGSARSDKTPPISFAKEEYRKAIHAWLRNWENNLMFGNNIHEFLEIQRKVLQECLYETAVWWYKYILQHSNKVVLWTQWDRWNQEFKIQSCWLLRTIAHHILWEKTQYSKNVLDIYNRVILEIHNDKVKQLWNIINRRTRNTEEIYKNYVLIDDRIENLLWAYKEIKNSWIPSYFVWILDPRHNNAIDKSNYINNVRKKIEESDDAEWFLKYLLVDDNFNASLLWDIIQTKNLQDVLFLVDFDSVVFNTQKYIENCTEKILEFVFEKKKS